jgi:hypothetical protein
MLKVSISKFPVWGLLLKMTTVVTIRGLPLYMCPVVFGFWRNIWRIILSLGHVCENVSYCENDSFCRNYSFTKLYC